MAKRTPAVPHSSTTWAHTAGGVEMTASVTRPGTSPTDLQTGTDPIDPPLGLTKCQLSAPHRASIAARSAISPWVRSTPPITATPSGWKNSSKSARRWAMGNRW